MFCAVTADRVRYEREVDRAEALEAAVDREESSIHADVELFHEVLKTAVMRAERLQSAERTTAGARWQAGSGINLASTTHDSAPCALAEVFCILASAEITGHGGAATAAGEDLIELIDQAKDFVVGAVRAAAEQRVAEGIADSAQGVEVAA